MLETKDIKIPLMLKHVPYVEEFSIGATANLGVLQLNIYADLDFIPDIGRWKSIKELKDVFKNRDHCDRCCSFLSCNCCRGGTGCTGTLFKCCCSCCTHFCSERIPPPESFDRYIFFNKKTT